MQRQTGDLADASGQDLSVYEVLVLFCLILGVLKAGAMA